jgi:hypothetical protein
MQSIKRHTNRLCASKRGCLHIVAGAASRVVRTDGPCRIPMANLAA